MGYASLNVANNGTVLVTSILHDIVGCITGRFSSSLQLTVANTGTSEIVNTLGQNWNFTYPASSSFVNNAPNNTIASWVLTAPCVNPNKLKYIRLTNYYKLATNGSSPSLNNTGTGASNLYTITTNPAGILLQAASSASNATTLINQTFHNTNIGSSVTPQTMITGPNIMVSWSSRHLVIWSNGVTTATSNILYGYIEFPETDVTVAQNLTPAAFLIERNGNLNSNIVSTTPYDANTATSYGDIQFPSFYSPTTAIVSATSFTGIANANIDVLTSTIGTTPKTVNTIPTINSAGSARLMMAPIIANVMSIGIPNMYLSTLSNMYSVANGLGVAGDTITVGSDTYAYLPSNTGMSFVVKKG